MAELTDVEATALGCVFRSRECTAHTVRNRFRQSASPRFSDSAGSIYPLMRRLQRRGLLSRVTKRHGRRDVDFYRLTAAGKNALRRWLGPPIPERDSVTLDPLRTKLVSLALLSRKQQQRWIDEAEVLLTSRLRVVKSKLREAQAETAPDVYTILAHDNAMRHLDANLSWLQKVRSVLQRRATDATAGPH